MLYQHFHGEGHLGLEDLSVQLIDWVKGEKELREKEGQWIYKLRTLRMYDSKYGESADSCKKS